MGWRGRGQLSPRGSTCERCGAPRRGKSGKRHYAVASCAECFRQICERHAVWDGDHWLCTIDARAAGINPKQR